ncbi:MAG: response regulator [Calditrichales bacterium]|nr:MAG: response regulator [Calditrichales bacterium]
MINFIIFVVIMIAADVLIRYSLKQAKAKKEIREREAALDKGLNLDFSHEAVSLKRVEVENPKARILCVDDETVILDSFRKILVLDGYSIDTVERGREVLALIQRNHYDFVFVDIKMPEMDGVEVTKQVKHVRPDIDVIIITGYASVDTAVETMKHGAMDYVEKPFTEDELLEMTKKCLIRRKDRIKKELGPSVHIAKMSDFESREVDEFSIPGGAFISEGHCWVSINEDGTVKIGLDDFAAKMLGKIDGVEPPNPGRVIVRGDALFNIKQNRRTLPFKSPVSGKIIKVNLRLAEDPGDITENPYNENWICMIDADHIDKELGELKIGRSAVGFFQEEITSCRAHFKDIVEKRKRDKSLAGVNGFCFGKIDSLTDPEWKRLTLKFFAK